MAYDIRPILVIVALFAVAPVTAEMSPQGPGKPTAPADYKIGADDVLTITVVGQDPKYSGDFAVRPDDKIALLLVDEVLAAGLTPMELRTALEKSYAKHFPSPVVLVVVKEIRSRKV